MESEDRARILQSRIRNESPTEAFPLSVQTYILQTSHKRPRKACADPKEFNGLQFYHTTTMVTFSDGWNG